MVGASIFHFAKGLAARKFFTGAIWSASPAAAAATRRGERHDDMHPTRESALAFWPARPSRRLVALGEDIYDEELSDRIWPGPSRSPRHTSTAGQRVWLVTATPVELATIIAAPAALTGALGTVAESPTASTPGICWAKSCTARPRRRGARARRARRAGARQVQRLLRLDQRRGAAVDRQPPGGRQPRLRVACRGEGPRLGDPRLSAPAARRH